MRKIFSNIKFKMMQFFCINKYKKYKRMCRENNDREWIIFNSPIHCNIGDHAIMLAEYNLLEKMGVYPFEVPTYYNKYYFDYIKKNISSDAIISITGGGFIGSQWMEEENSVNEVIKSFGDHNIIIFPQTIYFKDDEDGKREKEKSIYIYNKVKNLIIFTRENRSYEFAKNAYKNAKIYLIPDIVLSLNKTIPKQRRNGILLCLRNDVEGTFSKEEKTILENKLKIFNKEIKHTDTVVQHSIKENNRKYKVLEKIEEFAKSEFVITDRLHGMIFAAITDTPCIVFGNYNYKVEGVYQWIKDVNNNIIFKKDIKDIEESVKTIINAPKRETKNSEYDFSKLKKVITEVLE